MDRKQQGTSNREWGKQAETIAAEYLRAHGYIIRERNWRVGNSIEIDIIAEKDNTIVFVEVKARKGDFQQADDAVDTPHLFQYRLDIITLTGTPENYEIKHLEDAFLPPLR